MTTLNDLLLLEMSRRNTDMVADMILQRPLLFDELIVIFLSDKDPDNRRAGWVIDIVAEQHPEFLTPYLDRIAGSLHTFKHDALKRHALRMLARSPLPGPTVLGSLINICFDWLISPTIATAPKIFCMQLMYRISEIEPDLKKELADSIEWRMAEETPGFKNCGSKILKTLYKEIHANK